MQRASGLALAIALAFALAGCATGQIGGAASSGAAASQGSSTRGSATVIANFDLRVKCPGIHLERTRLGWSEDRIMKHESVTRDEIALCEAWTAAQPKGYVPPPPASVDPAVPDGTSDTRNANRSTHAAPGNETLKVR